MSAKQPVHASSDPRHELWIDAARAEFERHHQRAADWPTVASGPGNVLDEHPLREALPGYQLMGEISRGGQAVVYRARQNGTQRDVAIKVIRLPSTANTSVLARFEREVHILGQLKHSNVVTILDSGQTRGLLYYIMDYVDGCNLDEYLDLHKPDIHDRARLFAKICAAVSVAHLRGVTHRDLKPSNVRVDAAGEPHVLDFGLAKVKELDGSSAGHTLTGDFVGSLPWASPEQVEGRPEHLDIRTDVYSLGVMLFQALTGRRPYDVSGPLREAMERICQTEPPSVRGLNRAVDDDLSAIVARCLRKKPDERYQSAGDLQRELERYLRGDAIEAKRDSAWYVLRKAIHRHRGKAAAAALLLATGVYSVVLLSYLYKNEARLRGEAQTALATAETSQRAAEAARVEAEKQTRIAEAVNDFLNDDLLAAVRPDEKGREVTVAEVLDGAAARLNSRFEDQPEVRAPLHITLGRSYLELGKPKLAEAQFLAAYEIIRTKLGEDHRDAFFVRGELARIYQTTGRPAEASELARITLEYYERAAGRDHKETITARGNLGTTLLTMNQPEESERLLRETYEDALRVLGPENESTAHWMNSLAMVLRERGKLTEALPLQEQAVALARKLHGDDHTTTQSALGNLATTLRSLGRHDEAIQLYEQVLAARRRMLGEAHPSTLLTLNNLATMRGFLRQHEQAAALLEEGLRIGPTQIEPNHPTLISMRSNLATIYDRMGRPSEAEPLHRAAVVGGEAYLPADHPYLGLYRGRLGNCLRLLGCDEEAESFLLDGYRISRATEGPKSINATNAASSLVELYTAQGAEADLIAEWQLRAAGSEP
ncbi:MAG: serine/threonine-protein kinase [Phycisphaerae bacterium]|nr:serine/threonine-protein kinase [Phycisphaerae bacterium]